MAPSDDVVAGGFDRCWLETTVLSGSFVVRGAGGFWRRCCGQLAALWPCSPHLRHWSKDMVSLVGLLWCVGRSKPPKVQKPRSSYRKEAQQSRSSSCEYPLASHATRVFEHQASIRGKPVCLHAPCKRTPLGIKAAMRDMILEFCVLWVVWLFGRVSAVERAIAQCTRHPLHQATAIFLCRNAQLSLAMGSLHSVVSFMQSSIWSRVMLWNPESRPGCLNRQQFHLSSKQSRKNVTRDYYQSFLTKEGERRNENKIRPRDRGRLKSPKQEFTLQQSLSRF